MKLIIGGRSRCRSQYLSVPPAFKAESQAAVIHLPFIVVSAGLEPTHPEPKSGALPLGYETL